LCGDKVYLPPDINQHEGTANYFFNILLTDKNCKLIELITSDNQSFNFSFKGGAYQILDQAEDAIFTKREIDVLFYLIRGYSAKETGKKLSRSNRTIESHIENMKHKYGVNNRQQLIEKALINGYLSIMPSHLINI
jgi:DNA-binding CsgD family transcriptional regulator